MFNSFALVLMIFTFFSGVFWVIKYFKKGNDICSFFQCMFTKLLPSFCFDCFQQIKVCIFFKKVCCYCMCLFFDIYGSIFPVLFFIFMIRSFIFEPFQIPSGSMMPTLLSGDFILVNKFCYGIKNPITQSMFFKVNHPKRGDIVVFKYPLNTKLDYIKRVVGLPGDRVIYDALSKQLVIYPNFVLNSGKCKPLPITYTNIFPSNFVQIFNIGNGENNSNFYNVSSNKKINGGVRLIQSKESFNGAPHNILTMTVPGSYNFSSEMYTYGQLSEYLSEWVVPIGKYFMLGDNRDNSADSRYWGFVPEKNIVGKAIIIWMSLDKQQDNNWPMIRFCRIGRIY